MACLSPMAPSLPPPASCRAYTRTKPRLGVSLSALLQVPSALSPQLWDSGAATPLGENLTRSLFTIRKAGLGPRKGKTASHQNKDAGLRLKAMAGEFKSLRAHRQDSARRVTRRVTRGWERDRQVPETHWTAPLTNVGAPDQ